MDAAKKALNQATAQIRKLSLAARLAIGGVALAGGAVAITFAFLAPSGHRVLFSGLDPRDAASVVSALEAAKIPYELGSGGTSIRVEENEVDRARILLAEQNLPKTGNVGFELFEEQKFGLTDFAQRVNYRRALQGEIERTILAIDAIASTRVHVTQPERAVFADEKIPPTASVTVELVAGRRLDDRKVGAIRHLVAAAVEGLEPGDVTVVTTEGELLSRGDAGSAEAAAALDYESDLERGMEKRLVRLLERTMGAGGVEVTVAAEVDFSQTDTTEEIFDPEQTAVRNESLQEVHEDKSTGTPGGVAGAPANVAGQEAAGAGANGSRASRVVRSKNYEVNRTVVRTVGPQAQLKRLTVAVLVDGTYTVPEDGGEPVFTPRTDAEIAELQAVIENAIGFNAARGDRVKVASVPFRDRPSLSTADTVPDNALPDWWMFAAAGGLAAVGLGVWALTRKRRKSVMQPEVLKYPATVTQAERALEQVQSPQELDPRAPAGALPESSDPPPTTDDILALAVRDPERTADIIRAWMGSNESS